MVFISTLYGKYYTTEQCKRMAANFFSFGQELQNARWLHMECQHEIQHSEMP